MFILNFEKSGRVPFAHGKLQWFFQCFHVCFITQQNSRDSRLAFLRFVDYRIQLKSTILTNLSVIFSLLNVLQKIHVYRYQSSMSIRRAFPETFLELLHRIPITDTLAPAIVWIFYNSFGSGSTNPNTKKSNTCPNTWLFSSLDSEPLNPDKQIIKSLK